MVKSFPDQKEYLKKYLSGNKQKTKKKKKPENSSKGVKLIDDDEALKPGGFDDDDLIFDGEDAPQIVLGDGVEHSTVKESLSKWKTISSLEPKGEKPKFLNNFSTVDFPKNGKNNENFIVVKENSQPKKNNKYLKYEETNNLDNRSPSQKQIGNIVETCNESYSPLRKTDAKTHFIKRRQSISDLSPERKHKSNHGRKNYSPKLKNERSRSRDLSPQRKRESTRNDYSPLRKYVQNKKETYPAKERSSSVDISPRRKHHPALYTNKNGRDCKTSSSANRKNYKSQSPKNAVNLSLSQQYDRKNEYSSPSPKLLTNLHREKELIEERVTKMADGKSAGLRNAKDLAEEMKEFRQKELESSTYADEFAEPVIRSNVRNKIETSEQKIKKRKKEEDNEKRRETYNIWGKGLKQIENHKTKILEDEYESSKPLARYANDKDLDEMLKQVEREGDPMLEYLRSKKEKERVNKKQPELPIYKGNYPENRYGIGPGFRWDGVDRSNGYEKKYFEKQNAKRAVEEEAYRYSTEDM